MLSIWLFCSVFISVVALVECVPFPEGEIVAQLSNPILKQSRIGIQVSKLSGSKPIEKLFDRNAQALMTPASNNKVLTCAAIWELLGDAWTINTPFDVVQNQTNVIETFKIAGRGDPTWAYSDMQRLCDVLATRYSATHINEIVIEDKYFSGLVPLDWEFDDLVYDYGALPSSLSINENTVQLTLRVVDGKAQVDFNLSGDREYFNTKPFGINLDGVTILDGPNTVDAFYVFGDPHLYISGNLAKDQPLPFTAVAAVVSPTWLFISHLKVALKERGISFDRVVIDNNRNISNKATFILNSKSLAYMLNRTLQISDNMYAEILMRHLGRVYGAHGDPVSNGIQMVQKVFRESFGVSNEFYYQRDGSGMSRRNCIAPHGMIDLLLAISKKPEAANYISYLPRLNSYFDGTPAQNMVHAKTGTLTGVVSLSGYIFDNHKASEKILFSIIINDSKPNPAASTRKIIHNIVILLAKYLKNISV